MPALELRVSADISQLDQLKASINGMKNEVKAFAEEMKTAMGGTVQESAEDAKAHELVIEKLNNEIKKLQQQREASAKEHANRIEQLEAAHQAKMTAIAEGGTDALGRIRRKKKDEATAEASEEEGRSRYIHGVMLQTAKMTADGQIKENDRKVKTIATQEQWLRDVQVTSSKWTVKAQEDAAKAAKQARDIAIAEDTNSTYGLMRTPYSRTTLKRSSGNEYGAALAGEDAKWAAKEAEQRERLDAELAWERATRAQFEASQERQLQEHLAAEARQKEQFYRQQAAQLKDQLSAEARQRAEFYREQERQAKEHADRLLAMQERQRRITGQNNVYAALSPVDQLKMQRGALLSSLRGDDAELKFGSTALNNATGKSIQEIDQSIKALTASKTANNAKTREEISLQKELGAAYTDVKHAMRGLEYAGGVGFLSYGNMAPLAAAFGLSSAFKEALTVGKEFEHQMAMIGAVSDQSAAQMMTLGGNIRLMAHDSLYGPTEIAQGMKNLAQAGMTTSDAMSALPKILNMATLGEMDVGHAADIATGLMFAYNLQAKDMGHITDVISKVASDTKVDVGQMGESLKVASTVAGKYNISLEETAAALGVLAQRNITGTRAGTELKDMFERLVPTSKKVQEILDKVGLSFFDKNHNPKDMLKFLDELRAKVSTFDKDTQAGFFKTVFGQQGGTAAFTLVAGLDEYKKELEAGTQSAGYLDRAVQQLKDGVGAQMKMAWNDFQIAAISAFQAAEPALQEFLHMLREGLQSQGFQNFFSEVVSGLANLGTWLMKNGQQVWDTVKAYAALKAGMLAYTAVSTLPTVIKAVDAAITGLAARQATLAAEAEAAAGTEAAFGARLAALAGPMGAVMGALVTLGILQMEFGDKSLTAADKVADSVDQNLKNIQKEIDKYRERELAARGTLAATESEKRIQLAMTGVETAKKQVARAEADEKDFRSQRGLPRLLNNIAGAEPDMGQSSADDTAPASTSDAASRSAIARDTLARANTGLTETILAEAKLQTQREATAKAQADQAKEAAKGLPTGAVHLDFNGDKSGANKQYAADLNQENTDYRDQIQNAQNAARTQLQVLEAAHSAGLVGKTDYLKQMQSIQATADNAEEKALEHHVTELEALAKRADAAQKTRLQTNARHAQEELDRFRDQRTAREATDLIKSVQEYSKPAQDQQDKNEKHLAELKEENELLAAGVKIRKDAALAETENVIRRMQAFKGSPEWKQLGEMAGGHDMQQHYEANITSLQTQADQMRQNNAEQAVNKNLIESRLAIEKQLRDVQFSMMDARTAAIEKARYEVELKYRQEILRLTQEINKENDPAKKQSLINERAKYQAGQVTEQASVGSAVAQSYDQTHSMSAGVTGWFNDFKNQASDTAAQTKQFFTDAFGGATKALEQFIMYGKADIKGLERTVLQSLLNIAIQKAELGLVDTVIGGLTGGGTTGAFMGGMFGGASVGSGLTSAPVKDLAGNLISAGTKHSGGLVGVSDNPSRMVSAGLFAGAPRFHTGGIVGDEVPIIAKRGEGVFTPAQMAAMGSSNGGHTSNVVINLSPQTGSASAQGDTSGANWNQFGEQIGVMINQKLLEESRPGGLLYNQQQQARAY